MSSMRNAVQRRNHRERAQPAAREKWGLLEKHKDYSLRAKDHNLKKTKLKALRQKVLDKNPDEFYFGMLSRKGPTTSGKKRTGTVDGDRGNKSLSVDTVRLLKTQDLGYVRTMRNTAQKEVRELEDKVVGITGRGRKIVFVEDRAEQREKANGGFEGMDVDDSWEDDNEEAEEDLQTKKLRKLREKETEKLESKLKSARNRLKVLTIAEEELDLQRAKMGKSPTVGGVTKKGVKFKVRERKR